MAQTHFDERVAARYETYWPHLFRPEAIDPVVSFLADLAGNGGALELGVGTGRLALPLSRRGVRVHGIELSPTMAARLQAQPGADQIGITIGDFATTRVSETFRLAYLVRNTITNLTSQDEQTECFRSVAATCRLLCHRELHPPASAPPAGRDYPRVHRDADASGVRAVRPRCTDRCFTPLLGHRQPVAR